MLKPNQTITINPGLPAFEEFTSYTFKPVPDNPYFFWLEAPDGPSFVITRPEFFFTDYHVQVKQNSLANLHLEEKEPGVYLIVTVPEKTAEMTANLLAPLLVNEEKGLACQIVLTNTDYTTKHYLFPPEKRRHCG
ncbi:flagellar assembly protein FliW [Dethiobacter alkaliphilus]|uniref:flagellar assembly protein FliW n=1 Tax=Dethiobacter alkaliphilus TaxID=427926 RepID=UPI00222771F6|nr:flagellar assembly protein FliW [Dethiobacter alkaliphilus]MCW3488759.1 flagellar assembly protein FliW [Dethiobacter alkaliphilus]